MINISPEVALVLLFTVFLVPLFLGFPMGFSMLGAGFCVGFLALGPKVFSILYSQIVAIISNYIMVCIPLFIFMGFMIERSGIGAALFDTLEIWLHRLRGHLALVVVLTGTVLATCTGVMSGSVIMLGIVAMPHLMERGYNKELSTGCICAGGCLGILIPPSVMIVFLATLAEMSVGKLFMGAFGAGFLLSALYIAYITIACYIKPSLAPSRYDPKAVQIGWGNKIIMLFKSVIPVCVLILAVLGTIFTGVASPTEAAAAGAFTAVLLMIARKGFKWSSLKSTWSAVKGVSLDSVKMIGMMVPILMGAVVFMGVLMRLGCGEVIANTLLAVPGGKWGAWAAVMLVCILLGMVEGWVCTIFIVVPVVMPILPELGFDPIWFAVTICVNLQIGFMSPPFAVAIYYLREVTPAKYGVSLMHIIRGIIPFTILICIGLGLMLIFPEIILWLPRQMITG